MKTNNDDSADAVASQIAPRGVARRTSIFESRVRYVTIPLIQRDLVVIEQRFAVI